MAKTPINNGRKTDGTFAPGNALGGRTKGSRHKTTMAIEELLDGQAEALTQKAINAALDGDMVALRLCLDRITPAKKDAPVAFSLPAMESVTDAAKAAGAILEAVAAGDLTPSEGTAIAGLVETYRRTLESEELEGRIIALEKEQLK